jgi:hypothetical protein
MSLRCTVISLVPFDIREEKPGLVPPRFFIPASDGKTPQIIHVDTATHFVYLDENRGHLQVKNPSDVIAKSIVHDYCHSQLGLDDEAGPALFFVPEDLTLDEVMKKYNVEIARKLRRQRKWFVNLCKVADDDWRKYHQHNVISDFQRTCAELLGLNPKEHEWMDAMGMMNNLNKYCPYCYMSIPKEAPVCSNCSRVLDPAMVKQLDTQHLGVE